MKMVGLSRNGYLFFLFFFSKYTSDIVLEFIRNLSDVSNYVRSLTVHENDLYAGSNRLITIWNIETLKIQRQINIPGEVFSLLVIKGSSLQL